MRGSQAGHRLGCFCCFLCFPITVIFSSSLGAPCPRGKSGRRNPSVPAGAERVAPGAAGSPWTSGRTGDAGVSPPFDGLPGRTVPAATTYRRLPRHGDEGRGVPWRRAPPASPRRALCWARARRSGSSCGVGGPSAGGAAGGPASGGDGWSVGGGRRSRRGGGGSCGRSGGSRAHA